MEEEAWLSTSEVDRELVRLWRAWKTVHQMMQDRGYNVLDDELNMTLDAFRKKFAPDGQPNRNAMLIAFDPSPEMYAKHTPLPTRSEPNPTPTCGKALVKFTAEASPGIKTMRAFAQDLLEQYSTGIMITQTALTPAARKIIPAALPIVIELFQEMDLVVNITQHNLVPKHILLSPEEKKKLLERYRLKETQLPRIQISDPVARYLGLKRGNVVKIIRKSETAGRYASYRWTF